MADSSNHSLLVLEDVSRSFEDRSGENQILAGIDFRLGRRDSLAIIGPSGCGKTTLLLIIAGLLPPTTGKALINGRAVTAPRRETALVLQDYGLFPWKTVRQNIELGALVQRSPVRPETIDALEDELGIAGLDNHYPQQISGGQRQRVALARALLLSPRLLLLDEPFAALDALTRERLQQALLSLFARRKLSFIIVTHNIEEAVTLGQRVMVMGGHPARIRHILENPTFGIEEPRLNSDFYEVCVALRRLLKEVP
jgi:ABC-type nitrate/sulfonate/bicarbonate transport system ATPase subunit